MESVPKSYLADQRSHVRGDLLVFAEDQPQYEPLPAIRDAQGIVTTEWVPTAEELALLATGAPIKIRLQVHTFNRPLQPLNVSLLEL